MIQEKEIKYCKRCSVDFECCVNDIQNCQCSLVSISEATTQFLKSTFYDCLCSNCIQQINTMVNTNLNRVAPIPSQLIENTHYYKDGEYFVFTELYHYLKKQCCGNGCRHCAYGNNK